MNGLLHATAGSSIGRDTSVYINCPFDEGYKPIFDAVVFAVVCCGFMPRSALETGTVSTPRMQRIADAMYASKYSIHDLSRCKGEGNENLARFNMPLELGISLAMKFSATRDGAPHDWLLLVPRGHAYKNFVSDLAGYDPEEYASSASSVKDDVVAAVMSWLTTRPDAVGVEVSPDDVFPLLPIFEAERANLDHQWRNRTPWPQLVRLASKIAQGHLV
jgi:hypothetical protein